MASGIHRTTLEVRSRGVPKDLSDPDWIVNPDLSEVEGQPKRYWKIVGDAVQLMTQAERDAVDAAADAARIAAEKVEAKALADGASPAMYRLQMAIAKVTQQSIWAVNNGTLTTPQSIESLVEAVKAEIDNG